MKRLFILTVVFVFTMFSFFSCSDDDGYSLHDVWISLGVVKISDNAFGYQIFNDNGDTLVPMASSGIRFTPSDSMRVFVNYTILDEVDNSTKKFWIKVNEIRPVLFKVPIQLTEAINDSLGNDEVDVVAIWLVRDMLNIEFSYYGNILTHYINLVYTDKNMEQPLQFEFRHNAKGDGEFYKYRGLVTFDMKSIRREGQDSVVFVISAKGINGETQTFDSVYRY
jgi:hypothetical protein